MKEADFLIAIRKEPFDPVARQVFADWLEEIGDNRAELLRIQDELRSIEVPGRHHREQRMHELMAEGIQPLKVTRNSPVGNLVAILPGEFLMGYNLSASKYTSAGMDEAEQKEMQWKLYQRTRREVQISEGFYLCENLVTQEFWRSIMKTAPWDGTYSQAGKPTLPAYNVTWEQAVKFTRRLTARERKSGSIPKGWTFHLPTEAEWEYACRAGTSTRFSFGEDAVELENYAWYHEEERGCKPIQLKAPNPWGLYDMHGNLREWCREIYDPDLPYGGDTWISDSNSENSPPHRVHRGGCWNSHATGCQSAERNILAARSGGQTSPVQAEIGLRVALYPRDVD